MNFRDIAFDEDGKRRDDKYTPGVNFLSEDRRWRIVASDVFRPQQSEWQVWQHVDASSPIGDAKNWRRRLLWIRIPTPEHARVVAVALAALPANASWEVGRVAVRDALRTVGAAAFLHSVSAFNRAVARAAARVRTMAPSSPSAEDPGRETDGK